MKMIVLGATTGFGAAMVSEALAQKWQVHAISRKPATIMSRGPSTNSLMASQMDPMNDEGLAKIYEGADAVVFGLNVAYEHWDPFMIDALGATLRALKSLKTPPRLLFPGNVYALGRQHGPVFTEEAANTPCTNKGRLRAQMEAMLSKASETGLNVTIVRLADFFGPSVRNGLVDRIFGNAVMEKPIELIGASTSSHQLTYVPDAARVSVHLLGKPRKDGLQILNVPTHEVSSFTEFANNVAQEAGHQPLKVKKIPWLMIRLMGLVVPGSRELYELKYMFEDGVALSADKLSEEFPDFVATPIEIAIKDTLASYRKKHDTE